MNPLSRYLGCLLGLAVGDALGTTLEFKAPGDFEPLEGLVGGGPFGLRPGQWTDDTSMALCLAVSLVENQGFDAGDQMERYLHWRDAGYLSSTGRCFDIGNTVNAALTRYQQTGDPYSGSTDPQTAGNGSLMRLAPVPMAFANNPRRALHYCAESSRTTHAAVTALDACRYYGGVLVGALNGAHKNQLLFPQYCPVPRGWDEDRLTSKIAAVARGSFKTKQPPEIRGTGYVVNTLEAALWAFYQSNDFREGALLAANLGEDADTTAAVYGQLAGAHYGVEAIPAAWLEKIAERELIESLAEGLLSLAQLGPQ